MRENVALLILDVQIAPFAREKYDGIKLYNGEQLINNIALLIEKARLANIPIIYTQHTAGDNTPMGKGKPAWEIHPRIKPQEGDLVIFKNCVDPFYKTSLNEKLKALGVNELVITGIKTELAVDTCCRCAYSLGYKNILVSDGHSTFDSGILTAEQIIAHHNELIEGQAPFKEMGFAQLKKGVEVEF